MDTTHQQCKQHMPINQLFIYLALQFIASRCSFKWKNAFCCLHMFSIAHSMLFFISFWRHCCDRRRQRFISPFQTKNISAWNMIDYPLWILLKITKIMNSMEWTFWTRIIIMRNSFSVWYSIEFWFSILEPWN